MGLKSGTYLIRNRASRCYLVPDNGHTSGAHVNIKPRRANAEDSSGPECSDVDASESTDEETSDVVESLGQAVLEDQLKTIPFSNEVPTYAKIYVRKDDNAEDLYTFISATNLAIGSSPKAGEDGHHYLLWQEGEPQWRINSAGNGLWSVKKPFDALYWMDKRHFIEDSQETPPGPHTEVHQTMNEIVISIVISVKLPQHGASTYSNTSARINAPSEDDVRVILDSDDTPSGARWEFINA